MNRTVALGLHGGTRVGPITIDTKILKGNDLLHVVKENVRSFLTEDNNPNTNELVDSIRIGQVPADFVFTEANLDAVWESFA